MSSHHIVREKQEPALLIMSLEGFPAESLGQLLEWSPTVIVDENSYGQVNSLAIKIDAVISKSGDFSGQENIRIILTENDHLEDALKFLVGEHYPAVNVISDNFALKDYALYVDEINVAVFTPDKKIFAVRPGFSKWQSAHEQVFLMHDVHNLQVAGLHYLSETVLETEKDGFYSLSFDQPFIFIAESS